MARYSFTPFATAVAGLCLLVALALRPQPGDANLGLLFPPWVSPGDAFSRVAALQLPIIDIRLGGRLVVLRAPPDGSVTAFPRALRINPRLAALCADIRPSEESVS